MSDPMRIPGLSAKVRRQCLNPLCGKPLSNLNKKNLCFCCDHLVRMDRLTVPLYLVPAPRPRKFEP